MTNARRGSIEVCALTVELRREHNRVRSLREYVVARLKRLALRSERFAVLEDLSFRVDAGELFAVVGANGAGKTTLLRVLAGIVPPAAGSVSVGGSVAPLIDLGAGFDPELTGRENVLLYGSLLGMPRTWLAERRDAILGFAGVEAEADVPVKNYSSGMVARLGFAVATASKPAVLLVDEVLAVGDEGFRRQCAERIEQLRAQGTAVVLVTHDLSLVEQAADHAMLLDHGRAVACGSGAEVVRVQRRKLAA